MLAEKYAWDWKRLGAIFVTAALIMVFFPFKNPSNLSEWSQCYVVDLFYTFTIWEGCLFLTLKIREKFKGLQKTRIRLVLINGFVLIYTSISILLLESFVCYLKNIPFSWNGFWFSERVSLLVTLLVLSIYETAYYFEQWRLMALESEKLKQENTLAQLEGLKNQVNPHFLFNSLNTLTTIITENPPLAVDFVQKLAEVYRYVLNVKDKQTVSLETEMECVEAYIFLLKIRYEDHFHVEIHLSEASYSKHIPPVSIQMLVENAIKHNIISKGNPLKLAIYDSTNGYVVVENTFQPKILSGESTGIGLSNICSRYKYLTENEVIIEQKEGYFRVKLPLLIL